MAEDKIVLDVDVKPLKLQLREATNELFKAREKFGEFSKEAINAAKKVAGIKDSIEAAGEQAKLFDPGSRFQALTTAASTAAAGISAVQGAMALFGDQSESVGKALLKVQGALALSQGLSQLKDIGKVGEQLKSSFKGLTAGVDNFKKALISTGIGALVVALGLIVAYWDDIKGLVSGVSSEQKKLNKQAEENLKVEQEKLDAIDSSVNQLKLQGKSEKDILNLKLAQSKEAIKAAEINLVNAKNTQKAQVDAATRNRDILQGVIRFISAPLTILLSAIDNVGKAFGKNFGLEEGFSKGLANYVFDPKDVEKTGNEVIKAAETELNKLKEKTAGYRLSVKEIDKKAAEDKKASNKKKAEDELAFQNALNKTLQETNALAIKDANAKEIQTLKDNYAAQFKEIDANEKYTAAQKLALKKALTDKEAVELGIITDNQNKTRLEKQLSDLDYEISIADKSFQIQRDLLDKKDAALKDSFDKGIITEQEYNKAVKENSDARKQINEIELQNKLDNAAKISGLFGDLSNVLGKETKAGKVAAVAQATIDTYLSAQKSYTSLAGIPVIGPALGAVAAGVAVAGGIKNVKSILAVKTPGGGGSDASAPNIGKNAPIIGTNTPTLGQSPVTAIGSMLQNQPPIRAYVVETEITNAQKRVADIERRAGF
jgi:tRNA(Leu) C34 or U34 (ribose-2'-O)-methylase TrmL